MRDVATAEPLPQDVGDMALGVGATHTHGPRERVHDTRNVQTVFEQAPRQGCRRIEQRQFVVPAREEHPGVIKDEERHVRSDGNGFGISTAVPGAGVDAPALEGVTLVRP